MIVADTGAVVALIDADDRHHEALRNAFETEPSLWVLPSPILAEVDHLVATRLGARVARAFRADCASGAYSVEWGTDADLVRAVEIDLRHEDLDLDLVDALVMAMAERLRARAIATLDLRDFAAVTLEGGPELWPRDL